MTPLVIGIDPGTRESAYVAWDGAFMADVGLRPNLDVLRYLRSIDRRACVVFESVENYGMVTGRTVHQTIFWTGRLFQVARDTVGPTQVSRLPRRAVKKHLGLGPGCGDREVKAALLRRLDRNPEEWHGRLNSHKVAALAIAITWWNTERIRQPLKGRKKSA